MASLAAAVSWRAVPFVIRESQMTLTELMSNIVARTE